MVFFTSILNVSVAMSARHIHLAHTNDNSQPNNNDTNIYLQQQQQQHQYQQPPSPYHSSSPSSSSPSSSHVVPASSSSRVHILASPSEPVSSAFPFPSTSSPSSSVSASITSASVVVPSSSIPAFSSHPSPSSSSSSSSSSISPLRSSITSSPSSSTTIASSSRSSSSTSSSSSSIDSDVVPPTDPVTYSHIMHIPSTEYCRPGSVTSFRTNFLAGAVALSTAFAVMHPLDTLKTRMQAAASSATSASAAASASASAYPAFSSLFSRSTGRALLRGFFASIAGAAPQGGIRFSTYEYTKLSLQRRHQTLNQHPFILAAASAISGDVASSVIKVPREVIMQRMQVGMAGSTGSTAAAIAHVLKTEGMKGLYTGYLSTQCRDVPFMVILFSCYENAKAFTGDLCEKSSLCAALFGAASGGTAGFCTTPADVVKTKIMTTQKDTLLASGLAGGSGKMSMTRAYREILASQGWSGLMNGSIPRSVWWFCVCGIFFPTYETSKALLHRHHSQQQSLKQHQTMRAAQIMKI